MSITKGELVIRALKMLGVVDSITSADPEEIRDGLDYVDSMVSEWENHGINIEYLMPLDGIQSMPDDESGLTAQNVLGVAASLAVNMAPLMGREAQPTVKSRAKLFYEGLFSVELIQRQNDPMMPTGSGNCYLGGFQIPDEELAQI